MALDYTIMGERLREARQAKNMTQENLAEKLNVSVAFLSRIESGKTRINLVRLNEICTATGVPESYILNGTSEESPNYLSKELSKLLEKCSGEQRKQIYKIAEIIVNG